MNKIKRNELILKSKLNTTPKLDIKEAMELLGVSESTARRLFLNLEKNGDVIRSYGSICRIENNFVNTYNYDNLEGTDIASKKKIAEKAASLINDEDVVFLDGGTTMAQLSHQIATLLLEGKLNNITVYTNSLVNLNILKDITPISIIGGEYDDKRKAFLGFLAEVAIKQLNFTKSFLGMDGYNENTGFMATDYNAARFSTELVKNSEKTFILAHQRKFSQTSRVSFANPRDISAVITEKPPEECSERITKDIRFI